MHVIVNSAYPNRVELWLDTLNGPLSSPALGNFDPRLQLEVYVGGLPGLILSWSFDTANNRYLLYLASLIDTSAVVQVIYHMPIAPFVDLNNVVMPGFALIATVSSGTDRQTPAISLFAPSSVSTGDTIQVQWTATAVALLRITLTGGYDSGLFSASASAGVVFVPIQNAFSLYTLTLAAYDSNGIPILVDGIPLIDTLILTAEAGGGFGLVFGIAFGGVALSV